MLSAAELVAKPQTDELPALPKNEDDVEADKLYTVNADSLEFLND